MAKGTVPDFRERVTRRTWEPDLAQLLMNITA
jgi:hypothetical protein